MKNKENNDKGQFLEHVGKAIQKDFYLHKKTKGLTVKYVCDHYRISTSRFYRLFEEEMPTSYEIAVFSILHQINYLDMIQNEDIKVEVEFHIKELKKNFPTVSLSRKGKKTAVYYNTEEKSNESVVNEELFEYKRKLSDAEKDVGALRTQLGLMQQLLEMKDAYIKTIDHKDGK